MVRTSFDSKPYRRVIMETWGAECVPSPVDDPSSPGSLGLAISDAVRDAAGREDSHYSLGSVLNHVLLHQTVIGLEAKEQLALAGEPLPDVVIAPCGGGSNLGGLALPFLEDPDVRLVAVEPSSCPTLTEGRFEYDFGDTGGMTPLLPMYTLGHDFMPPAIHAGGLRYHGDAPIISLLVKIGRMEAIAYPQGKVFEAGQAVRRGRGQGGGAGGVPRHPGRHRRGAGGQGDGRGEGDPVQLLRPRLPRPGRLRRLQPRPPHRRLTDVLTRFRDMRAVAHEWRRAPARVSCSGTLPTGMFVKICGITNEDDALLAVALGADAVGFVFAPSVRQISVQHAYDISRRLPPEIMTVGVFRDAAPDWVVQQMRDAGLKAAQLHGHETPEDTQAVRRQIGYVIQAFPAGSPALERAAAHGADVVLVDSATPGLGHACSTGPSSTRRPSTPRSSSPVASPPTTWPPPSPG